MKEIERKFLVKYLPKMFGEVKSSLIIQSYLNQPDDLTEIRIRNYDNERYYLDFKGPGDMIREENGIKITKEQYDKLNTTDKHIVKKRYYLNEGIFLDIYKGELEGLMTVEKEGTLEEVENFAVPDWFGEEVTNDKKYKNRNLFFSFNKNP